MFSASIYRLTRPTEAGVCHRRLVEDPAPMKFNRPYPHHLSSTLLNLIQEHRRHQLVSGLSCVLHVTNPKATMPIVHADQREDQGSSSQEASKARRSAKRRERRRRQRVAIQPVNGGGNPSEGPSRPHTMRRTVSGNPHSPSTECSITLDTQMDHWDRPHLGTHEDIQLSHQEELERHAVQSRLRQQERDTRESQSALEGSRERRGREDCADSNEDGLGKERRVFSSTGVTFGAGLQVEDVLSAMESKRSTISKVPPDCTLEELHQSLRRHGVDPQGVYIEFPAIYDEDFSVYHDAYILCDERAAQKLAKIHQLEYNGHPVSVVPAHGARLGDMRRSSRDALQIGWREPSSSVVVSCPNAAIARQQAMNFNNQLLSGSKVTVHTSFRVPRKTTNREIKRFSNSNDIIQHHQLKFDVPGSFIAVRANCNVKAFGLKAFEAHDRVPSDCQLRATAHFTTWTGAKKAHDSLNRQLPFLDNQRPHLVLSSRYQFEIPIEREQYIIQKRSWDAFSHTFKGNNLSPLRFIVDEFGGALCTNQVSHRAAGKKVKIWDRSLAISGALEKIALDTRTFIRSDSKNNVLRIYGTYQDVDLCEKNIRKEIKRLEAFHSSRVIPPDTVEFMVREGIHRMKMMMGEQNVTVNASGTPCSITFPEGGKQTQCWKIFSTKLVISTGSQARKEPSTYS
ncbi:hypothetical protein BDV98DRAFT_600068 [Pterulicium gracile]|uniref:Uncharacterized protein n=1 Tax=Pterulicium gracile TaxID=1884261 RepID=A0A5C3R0K2_9AGAR|nr:hypothetical protein BDV98DRAFT_600068 [Pterula gracilis]